MARAPFHSPSRFPELKAAVDAAKALPLPTDPLWCPECKKTSPRSEWEDEEFPCEDCGEHAGLICPHCEIGFDTVFVKLGPAPEGDL